MLLCTAAVLCGCGKEKYQSPPEERSHLVLRLFDSMKKGDAAQAAIQAGRLQAMNTSSVYLRTAIDTMTANTYLSAAQQHLNSGNAAAALDAVLKGTSEHPFNPYLRQAAEELQKLNRLEKALHDFRAAADSPQMSVQLKLVETAAKPYADSQGYRGLSSKLNAEIAARKRLERLQRALVCDSVIEMIDIVDSGDAERRSAARAVRELLLGPKGSPR